MKVLLLNLLLGSSLLAAILLGAKALRGLYILSFVHPAEIAYFPAPRSRIILAALISLCPLALYFIAWVVSRELAWSTFGKFVCSTHLLYLGILVFTRIYFHHVLATLPGTQS